MPKTGGPAFPRPYAGDSGMTLRDYFAGQALCGYLASHSMDVAELRDAAQYAYAYADAMLTEREKGGA